MFIYIFTIFVMDPIALHFFVLSPFSSGAIFLLLDRRTLKAVEKDRGQLSLPVAASLKKPSPRLSISCRCMAGEEGHAEAGSCRDCSHTSRSWKPWPNSGVGS